MTEFHPFLIAAVDIGSPMAGKLGWATLPNGYSGADISELVSQVSGALLEGPVALGFEAPLWIPKRSEVMALTKARQGEGSRSWSAGAGTGVLATGLAVIPYILAAIREASPSTEVSLDFHNAPSEANHLLLWEAFVSAADKGKSHEDDAMIAAKSFQRACADLPAFQKLAPEPCLNLLGAMLLRTGWSTDLGLLEADTLVVRV
jgi:hypothetical protein